ncbi:MAG: glycerophosphodiester phosphodiesterase [Actinomycetota bacterium]|nr:glycerophosphodiester phosphodiesterase [Actinomycetota bacterium]
MITPEELGRPLVLGHRGASAHAGDNTIEAFELAVAHGADGVELDVRFTSDRAVMLNHWPDVGEMGPLIHHDFATIRKAHPEIPTLDEALPVLGDLIINVEIKNFPYDPDFDPTHRMAGVVARWIAQHDIHDRVVVTSFNPDTIGAVRLADDRILTGQLVKPGNDVAGIVDGLAVIATAGHLWIAPFVVDVVAHADEIVQAARAVGLGVIVWTVDDPGDIATLTTAGVAGIITNDPAATLRVIAGATAD